ncbi:hypothetical protein F4604DRAFT_1687054 [Suillus subluteus]|nr:hypothetical protein F4604DRAFT_1687054 [Suillus subluteus]
MTSTGPTRQALSNILNNTDSAPSQHQHRNRRPSEKALYQVEEDQEHHEACCRPSGQEKIKATRKNRVDRGTHDSTQFSTQAIALSRGSVPSNSPLDLRPRFSKVHTPALSRTSVSGGWQEDPLTKESGFGDREQRSNGLSLPPAPRKLTVAHANELIQLRRVQSNGSIGDDIDLTDGKQNDNGGQFDDDEDLIDVFTGGETYHGEGNNYEDLHHLKHVRLPPSDDEGDSTQSHKRMRESKNSPSPHKGRVAARDYEVAVQQLIKYAISHFCIWLASEYAYPDRMTQVVWVKEAWKEACSCYEMEMGFNGEIIQMITRCTSHLTSEVKAKVQLLVENIYGFESTNRESIKCRNRKCTRQLKDKFGLCYRDLGDKKNNVPRSGLFRSRLNQQAANLLWYRNKKDEGIVFEKFFFRRFQCQPWPWCTPHFSSGDYREVYDKHLTNLKKFDTRTKDHGILDGILMELNNNGRLHAKVDPIDVRDGDCLSDNEINKAIREYQQGGGADSSDEVESDLESEGGQFEVDEVEAE